MNQQATNRYPASRFVARYVVPIAILGGAAALLAITSWRALERLPEAQVTPVAVIASSRPASSRADGGLQAPGWIEPAPYAVEVRALREGVVDDFHVLEGTRVAKGDLLVTLERRAQEVAVAKANAELRLADADIESKTAALHAAERTLVLAIEAERAVRSAESALHEAEAMRGKLASDIAEAEALEAEARDEHERKLKLVESGSASAGEARRLGLRVTALAAKSESLRQERPARESKVVAARGDLEAARTKRAELTDETRARDEAKAALAASTAMRDSRAAMRDEATLALERSDIRAPRDGVVLTRLARPGSRVGGDAEALVTLFDPSKLQVRCDVPLKDAGKLAIGLAAEIRVDALPDRVFHGKVVRIVPQGDIQKNTVQCKVEIDAPDAALRPDMLARVRIESSGTAAASAKGEALAVPADALRSRTDDAGEIIVAMPDAGAARTELRRVTLGSERANGWIEILDGLNAGDRVVLDGAVRAGSRIKPIESPKSEPATGEAP